MANLNSLSKLNLVAVGRRLGIKIGDYARLSKGDLVSLVASYPNAQALESAVNEVVGITMPTGMTAPEQQPIAAPAVGLLDSTAFAQPAFVPKVIEKKTCKEVFGIDLKDAEGNRIMAYVWDDPEAPEVDPLYRFEKDLLQLAMAAISGGDNMWLCGPKGTGKTEFVKNLCARLGRAFIRVNFDASAEKYEFLGGERMRGGSTVWQDGAILRGMQRAGAIILLDEFCRSRPEYTIALNPILERGGKATIVETGQVVKRAEGVVFAAADNSNGTGDPSGKYVVREMDSSTVDRFEVMMYFDYPPEEVEIGIIKDRTGCNEQLATEVVRFMHVARNAAVGGTLTDPPGLRQAMAWAKLIHAGVAPRKAFEAAIANKCDTASREEMQQLFVQNVDVGVYRAASKGKLAEYMATAEAKEAQAAMEAAKVDGVAQQS
jgi:MoxR-like ATPase